MNVYDRIKELESQRAALLQKHRARKDVTTIVAGQQYRLEVEPIERELLALRSPIISMVVTHDNRVLVASAEAVFELKDDKLQLLTFERTI